MIFYMKLKKGKLLTWRQHRTLTITSISHVIPNSLITQTFHLKIYTNLCHFSKRKIKGTYSPNPTEMDMQLNFHN